MANLSLVRVLTVVFICLNTCRLYAEPLIRRQYQLSKTQTVDPYVPVGVVPPKDWQTGGSELFMSLRAWPGNERIFVDQHLNLEFLGPGTTIIFVCDRSGTHWAFAISNGRFDWLEDIGSVSHGTYPNRLPAGNNETREGKYPWPVDYQGNYLPGNHLVTSNTPHALLAEVLKQHGYTKGPLLGGHVGIDMNGQAYVGYVSGSVNAQLRALNGTSEADIDDRVMPAQFRSTFHEGLRKSMSGRGLRRVLERAPELTEQVNKENAWFFFPPQEMRAALKTKMLRTPFELLHHRWGEEQLNNYVKSIDIEKAIILLDHPYLKNKPVLANKRQQWLQYLRQRSVQLAFFLSSRFQVSAPSYFGPGDDPYLIWAVKAKENKVIHFLLNQGFDPDMQGIEGMASIHIAVQQNNIELVKLLARYGANLSAQNKFGDTALHMAARNGQFVLLRELIREGVHPNTQDSDGDTVLHAAVKAKNIEMVKFLIQRGANPHIKNLSGKNSFELALQVNRHDIYDVLLNPRINHTGILDRSAVGFDPTLMRAQSLDGFCHQVFSSSQ